MRTWEGCSAPLGFHLKGLLEPGKGAQEEVADLRRQRLKKRAQARLLGIVGPPLGCSAAQQAAKQLFQGLHLHPGGACGGFASFLRLQQGRVHQPQGKPVEDAELLLKGCGLVPRIRRGFQGLASLAQGRCETGGRGPFGPRGSGARSGRRGNRWVEHAPVKKILRQTFRAQFAPVQAPRRRTVDWLNGEIA